MAAGPAVAARLEALAALHALPAGAVPALTVLLDALAGEHAPTTVKDPDVGVDVHVADSLVALEAIGRPQAIADLGAGAGVPGLVLAAALSGSEVVLVESARRKTEFIAETAEAMGLTNARVVWARAEEWREGIGACDVVCARAVAPLNVLCEYAAPLLRTGGTAVFWKGEVDEREAADGAAAAAALGLAAPVTRAVTPFRGSARRTLWTFEKVAETPPRFPRRAGMAQKRPISATSV